MKKEIQFTSPLRCSLKMLMLFLQSILILAQLGLAKQERKHVELVMSLDQYYDTANNNDSYTMVEYTTSWCHHCKKLAPNFVELMQSYEEDATEPKVNFLEVNCEIFGSTICSGFPGFPMIHLIQPRNKPLALPSTKSSEPLWRKVVNYLTSKYKDPRWQLDSERVIEYNGSRDAKAMRAFIEAVRGKDKRLNLVDKVSDSDYDCSSEKQQNLQKLCEDGKKYLESTLSGFTSTQLAKERLKLENILQNNDEAKDSEGYNTIRFKLELLNRLLINQDIHDEL